MKSVEVTNVMAREVSCPNCKAKPGSLCVNPINKDKPEVPYAHYARKVAFCEEHG